MTRANRNGDKTGNLSVEEKNVMNGFESDAGRFSFYSSGKNGAAAAAEKPRVTKRKMGIRRRITR